MKIPRPSFLKLVSNYTTTGTHDCSMTFPNTCAVRMSEALVKTDHRFLYEFSPPYTFLSKRWHLI
jgi:hypothetical protein